MAARVPPPTPQEIAMRAREIRLGWSARELEKRRSYKTTVVYAPIPDTCFSDRAACSTDFKPTRRLMPLD